MATATRRAPSPVLDPELGEAGKSLLDPTGLRRKKSEDAQVRPATFENPIERGFNANLLPPEILNAKITMAKGRRRTKKKSRKARRGGGKKEDVEALLPVILESFDKFKQAKELKLRPSEAALDRQEAVIEQLRDILLTVTPAESNDPALRPALKDTADAFRETQALQKEVIELPTSNTAPAAARKKKTRRKTRK